MRICLIISSLRAGGAERVLSRIAGCWAEVHEVSVITLGPPADDFFRLHKAVRRLWVDASPPPLGNVRQVLGATLHRIRQLRRVVREYEADVVICFGDIMNIVTLAALCGTDVPVIVAERTDPVEHRIANIWRTLRRVLYPNAAAVVVQTQKVRNWVARFVRPERIAVIPNPVELPPKHATADADAGFPADGRRLKVIAIGRLSQEKGFDLLIRAFAKCSREGLSWSLTIFGDGAERPALEALVRQLNLGDRVTLPGRVSDPTAYLATAQMFVLASRYEGFPNALLEAMAAGLPVIATNCPSGPAEIIRDGYDGILVPTGDVDALARTMESLMSDSDLRAHLSARAIEVTARFGAARIMTLWNELLLRVLEDEGQTGSGCKRPELPLSRVDRSGSQPASRPPHTTSKRTV